MTSANVSTLYLHATTNSLAVPRPLPEHPARQSLVRARVRSRDANAASATAARVDRADLVDTAIGVGGASPVAARGGAQDASA